MDLEHLTDLERRLIEMVVTLYMLHGTFGLASFRKAQTAHGIPELIEDATGLSVESTVERNQLRKALRGLS